MNIAVFVSGRGSNFKSILTSEQTKDTIKIKGLFSDKKLCPAFEIAKEYSVPAYSIGSKEGMILYTELSGILEELQVELIVLAGYLKLIPADIVAKYKWKIINIHPALLPSFGGSGMYGINVHKAVYESSAKISGATVHFVDDTYDTGKIIAQRCIDISDAGSPEEIAERVLKIEHELLPFVVRKFAENKVIIAEKRALILP